MARGLDDSDGTRSPDMVAVAEGCEEVRVGGEEGKVKASTDRRKGCELRVGRRWRRSCDMAAVGNRLAPPFKPSVRPSPLWHVP